jgi:hypothetical protein
MRRLYRGECERIESTQLRVGRWIALNLPTGARVATHDVGAIAFAGERPVVDLVGLVTPDLAGLFRAGEGALWEALDALPVEIRPTLQCPRLDALSRASISWNPCSPGTRAIRSARCQTFGLALSCKRGSRQTGPKFRNMPGAPGRERIWRVMDQVDVADLASARPCLFRRWRQGRPSSASWAPVDPAEDRALGQSAT